MVLSIVHIFTQQNTYWQARVQVQGLSQISNKRPGPGAWFYNCMSPPPPPPPTIKLFWLGSRSVPSQVQVRSRLGPGQLHVNSKSFSVKVYFKSLRDLDLEFEAIIAISPPPTHHHFSEWNKIENSSHINSLVIKVKISESHIQTSRAEGPSSLCICLLFFRYQIWTCYSRKSVAFLPRGTIPPLYWNNRNHWYQHFIQTGTNQMKHYSSWSSSPWFFPVCISLNLKAQLFFL